MWKRHTIIHTDSWNKGIIQIKNILLLQYLIPVILLWHFDYRLIQYQRNLHCLWSGCKTKWPVQSHGKSLAKKGGDPTFPDSLWFLIFLGNGFWLHLSQRAVKGRWGWKDPQEQEGFTPSWSGVGECKWEMCNLLPSRRPNKISSLCEQRFPDHSLHRWSFLHDWKSPHSCLKQVGRNCSWWWWHATLNTNTPEHNLKISKIEFLNAFFFWWKR